jgi:hypothetical protein
VSLADDIRVRAKAAEARLNPGRRGPPPADTGTIIGEAAIGRGRTMRVTAAIAKQGEGVWIELRCWAEGFPTSGAVAFRAESLPAVALALAGALDALPSPASHTRGNGHAAREPARDPLDSGAGNSQRSQEGAHEASK